MSSTSKDDNIKELKKAMDQKIKDKEISASRGADGLWTIKIGTDKYNCNITDAGFAISGLNNNYRGKITDIDSWVKEMANAEVKETKTSRPRP